MLNKLAKYYPGNCFEMDIMIQLLTITQGVLQLNLNPLFVLNILEIREFNDFNAFPTYSKQRYV